MRESALQAYDSLAVIVYRNDTNREKPTAMTEQQKPCAGLVQPASENIQPVGEQIQPKIECSIVAPTSALVVESNEQLLPCMYRWKPPMVVRIALWTLGCWYIPFMVALFSPICRALSTSDVHQNSLLKGYPVWIGVFVGSMVLFVLLYTNNRWFRRRGTFMLVAWCLGSWLYWLIWLLPLGWTFPLEFDAFRNW